MIGGRRALLRAAATAGLALVGLPALARPPYRPPPLRVLTWRHYDRPAFRGAYEPAEGTAPAFVYFDSQEEALGRLARGLRPDVMHPCSHGLRRWHEAGLLQPLDVGRLSNFAGLWDGLLSIPDTVRDGYRFFVPFDCGQASVLYRTDLVDAADAEEDSWDLLFNDLYAGRLAMHDGGLAMVEVAALVLGFDGSAGLDAAQLDEVRQLLVRQRDMVRFYWRDPAEMEHALASGEIAAAFAWNDSARRVADMGVPVRFMRPREGRLTWACGFVRHAAAAGDEAEAHAFIDAMLSPAAGQALIEEFGVGHASRGAYDRVEGELLVRLGLDRPADLFGRCHVPQEPEEPRRSRYLNLVNAVKAGLD